MARRAETHYGYEPIVLTTTRKGPWRTAWRCAHQDLAIAPAGLAPFSDHCNPLVDAPGDLSQMIEFLRGEVEKGRSRSFELRPVPESRWQMEGDPFLS